MNKITCLNTSGAPASKRNARGRQSAVFGFFLQYRQAGHYYGYHTHQFDEDVE